MQPLPSEQTLKENSGIGVHAQSRQLEILLLGVHPKSNANTIVDHLRAFKLYSRHRVHFLQNLTALYGTFGGRIGTLPKLLDLRAFDVLVIHYTNYLPSDECFDRVTRDRIGKFRGLKVLFLQDEYRQINLITEHARQLGVDVLFTCVPEPEIEKVYPTAKLPNVTKVPTLTGYVPEGLVARDVPPLSRRSIDVGYRARQVPYWLGELGQEKWEIVPKFIAATQGKGLALDLSYEETDRLYGEAWVDFITSCKATLGVESGASVFDFTGDIQRSVENYVAEHPRASFQDVQKRFFREHEGLISLNQISPRYFEAAALRTAMVLYEGRYSDILRPWQHYIPLRKDFGNISEVIAAIKDTGKLQQMADRAYEEIARNPRYSYRRFMETFDGIVEIEINARRKSAPGSLTRPAVRVASWYRSHALTLLMLRANESFRFIQLSTYRLLRGYVYGAYRLLVPRYVRDRLRPFIRRYVFGQGRG